MTTQITQGPTGRVVAQNITRLRVARRFNIAELSRELRAVGVTLPVLSIRKIEEGQRRITIDDVLGFARVFDARLAELLLGVDDPEVEVPVTGYLEPVPAARARAELGLREPDILIRFSAEDVARMAADDTAPAELRDTFRKFLAIQVKRPEGES